jgi:hypothetical protein
MKYLSYITTIELSKVLQPTDNSNSVVVLPAYLLPQPMGSKTHELANLSKIC